jgi:hypothetical protein
VVPLEASSNTAIRKASGNLTTGNLTNYSRNTSVILITLLALSLLSGCALSNALAISQMPVSRRITNHYLRINLTISVDALPGK